METGMVEMRAKTFGTGNPSYSHGSRGPLFPSSLFSIAFDGLKVFSIGSSVGTLEPASAALRPELTWAIRT